MGQSGKVVIRNDGFCLFMRFADGCRCYLMDKGAISKEDNHIILDYFRTGEKPPMDVVKRVYYVAYPRLEEVSKKTSRDMFDINAVRRFYAYDHNRMKTEQGEYACIAFPARVLETKTKGVFLDLSPVRGRFWATSDLDLSIGDWVIVHRINVIEKISEAYAKEVSDYLIKLGLNKEMKFPKVAIKYLERLRSEVDGYA